MNENLKTFLRTVWNEPRLFFLWLTLFSLAGFLLGVMLDHTDVFPQHPSPWMQTCACVCVVVLAAGIVGGFLGYVLSWIPPIRQLLAWMLQRRFFLLACLVTVIALFYTEENWRGKRALEQFKRQWEAKGEHFELAKIAPPPVPDDQNFAMAPIVMTTYSRYVDRNGRKIPTDSNVVNRLEMPIEIAAPKFKSPVDELEAPAIGNWQKALKTDLGAWQTYYRKAAALTNLFPVPPQPQAPAADVLLALSKYDSAIEELRQASQRPYSRFPLEYDADDPSAVLLPHLAALKGCTRLLQLRSIAELNVGQTEKALDDIKLMLRLTDAARNEPFLISHLVRIALVNLALQPVWEGVADHRWSDGQLATLDQELGKLDFFADYRAGVRGEQTCSAGVIDYLRRTRNIDFMSLASDDKVYAAMIPSALLMRLIPSGWFYQNQLRCERYMVRWCVPLADLEHRTISPTSARQADEALMSDIRHTNPYNWFERLLLPALSKVVRRFATAQTSVDLARVACALERYRLAHGEYPKSLGTLAPQFIEKPPHDIINGQPLKYRRTEGGLFVLYSVGWNETDDGGQVALTRKDGPVDAAQGDWVWQCSAK
jgi:tetratricopeptide (TPR) repeat protein